MRRFIATFTIILIGCLSAETHASTSIKPGVTWNDTSGKQINAHGGCVIYSNGNYYWFGEDRTGSTSNGISCYRSTDLYNWTKLGIAFAPSGTQREDLNDFAPGRLVERPKVIYNDSTKKWVMYGHWENGTDYGEARVCVATSDKIEGPYTFYKTFRPNGHDSRDQTIFKDTDNKAYHFCSTDMNSNMNLCLLRGDYLEPTPTETKILKSMSYEAPAIFKVGDIYHGLFSGCTGWNPNPGRTAYSTDILGTWTVGENFAVDNLRDIAYNSQSTYVFKVNGKDGAYVYMGDRWNSSNVGASQVVWLPLSMRSGYPSARWMDSWDLSVFDNMYRYKRAKQLVAGNSYSLLEKFSNRLVSKPANGFTLQDDDDTLNLSFTLLATDNPYIYKLKDTKTGNFLESSFGTLRLTAENSAESQKWRFDLKQDGYYNIVNVSDNKCLTTSGSGTEAGTFLYLAKVNTSLHQYFAMYFDSKKYTYEEADLFSASYITNNLKLMEEQANYTALPEITGETDFNLIPAQNNGQFSVYLAKDIQNSQVLIELMNAISGKLCYSQQVESGSPSLSFNLQGLLQQGIYLLRARTGQKIYVKKMIVVR